MSDIAIRVENLGKQYRIGGKQAANRTFREAFLDSFTAPLRWIRGERKTFETFWALDDVSFEINRGEVVGIIGRNGAGKSTLLKVLSRITKPTRGHVDLYGRVASLLEVGTGFHSELSGRDNIYLNGAILGMTRREIEAKFDEIVTFADIEKFLDTQVKHYSSGMYMRLAFAIAAHLEPEILLIDEVLAVGDAEFQKKSIGKMKQVAQAGRTVLFVSHNMNAIEMLCPKAIRLEKGQFLAFDDSRKVVQDYLESNNKRGGNENQTRFDGIKNSFFEVNSFKVVDNDMQEVDEISASNNIGILIEGDLIAAHTALTIGFAIYTINGDLLFWSYATDEKENNWPKLSAGNNRLVGWIPSHFLNEGEYIVELMISLHFIEWISEPGRNAPSIQFSVRGGLSQSPYWILARPGMLAPIIKYDLL
jgi:lipopolysaccharide transport system ATP-binding protein